MQLIHGIPNAMHVAFNGMDNGCLELRGVRVPRFHMCSRFARVEKGSGKYVKVPNAHPKIAYLTMMQVRALVLDRWLGSQCPVCRWIRKPRPTDPTHVHINPPNTRCAP